MSQVVSGGPNQATSNPHPTRHPSRDLQEIGLHIDDLVVAVPFVREEVLQAIGLKLDETVEEAVGRRQSPVMCVNQS